MSLLKQIVLLIVIAGAAAAGYFGWERFTQSEQASSPAGAPAERLVAVVTAPASMREMETLLEAVGSTRARRSVVITPASSGRVSEIRIEPGKAVSSGDLLLKLEDDIERADVAEAAARVRDAEGRLSRAQTLRQSNTVAEATVEQLTAELAIARAQLDRAQSRLRDRSILAPFNGVVGFTDIDVGAQVDVGEALTVIDDLSVIEVEFSLPERWFGQIRPGKMVQARSAVSADRVFTGLVDVIDSRIDPLSRSFRVRATIDNEENMLPAGMFMHLSVVVNQRDTLAIPEEAVVFEGNSAFSFVASAGADGTQRAERRPLKLGARAFGYVEVLDGVSLGEQVVIRGVQKVRDGVGLSVKTGDGGPTSESAGSPQVGS